MNSTSDRDLVVVAFVMAALVALAGALSLLVIGLVMAAAWRTGNPATWPAVQDWLLVVVDILMQPGDPGAAAGSPWAEQLAGHAAVYWLTTAGLALPVIGGAVTLIVLWWRRYGPTKPGHASRREVRRELSLSAARRTAAWTRPSLSAAERRGAPGPEVGAPLHRGPVGRMYSPLENPTGTLAPTQSGKSRRDLVHKSIDAPGALLCSTTKPDLLEYAGLARTRRLMAGPVLVFDATGSASWPAKLRWSPIAGCTDWPTAFRRARTMVEASATGLAGVGGNDKVFRERAYVVIGAYLLAADLYDRDVSTILEWAISKPPSREPVEMLEYAFPEIAYNLRNEMGMVDETADAVWMSVRRVIEPFMDPQLRDLCSPPPGEAVDIEAFIREQGSLFLVAGQHQAAQAVPVLTALAEQWLTTAQELALLQPARRLDPPATAVLDELPNATPIPILPDVISDSAGRGIVTHWAAQSMAQLEDTFTPPRARQLLDNTTTLSIWGALKDKGALEWASTLSGHYEKTRQSISSDGLFSMGRASFNTETAQTLKPGDVRNIPRGKVLVLHRSLRPILATAVDVSERPDYKQLSADSRAIRSGNPPVTEDGFAIRTRHMTPGLLPATAS